MRLLANSFYGDSNCFQFFCGLFLLKTVKQAKHISETRSSDNFTNYALYYVRLKGIRMSSSYSAPVVTAWHFSLRYVCVCNVCVCMLARVHVVMKYCISFIEYYTHVLMCYAYLRFGILNWYCSADDRAMPLPTIL